MALSIEAAGDTTISTGNNQLASVSMSGVYSGLILLGFFDTCVVRAHWYLYRSLGSSGHAWRSDAVTVDLAGLVTAILTPPVPVATLGELVLELVSGTPTGDAQWELYKL